MDLAAIGAEVCKLAKETGEYIRREGLHFNRLDVEVKSSNSFVSYVDKEAEKMIVTRLKQLLPDAGYIAEEGTAINNTNKSTWIIDPLDGTTNFIHGIPCFAVSIALEVNGELVIGVVYEISNDECFYAYKGGGAYLNDKRIHCSAQGELVQTLIATGFPYYDYSKHQNYLNFMGYLMTETRGLRRLGSAATDLAYVAAGRFDAFFEYGLNSWDVAAGILLVREAGGIVSEFNGGDDCLYGAEIVAANPKIYPPFIAGVQEYF